MKLPQIAIQNHRFTLILLLLFVISGVVSFFSMPKTEDPVVQPPGASVIVLYPGASPADVEELIVEPIEEVINELEDIEELNSEASDGLAVISVEFSAGSDSDEKYDLVVQKVNSIRNELPDNMHSLELWQWSISDVHIMQLALVSETAPYHYLRREAERLQEDLERIPDVRKIELWALPDQQVRVSVDLYKLAQLRIPLKRISGAIQDANMNIPGGHVDVGSRRLNIKTSGTFESLDELKSTVVFSDQGRNVQLQDVATVEYSTSDVNYKGRHNGKRCIFITASQKPGTNIFTIFEQMRPRIDAFKKELPATMTLETAFDQSKSVSRRIQGFFMNLLQGIVLVGIVVLAAVGARPAVIVMLAIPVSILIALGFVDLSGFGLQQMSIAGMVIALGLLVDNAIVVTENSARFIRKGYSRQEAAIAGTSQIGWAVVSATTTTVLAFIPIIMIGDMTGDFIRSMPVTVVYILTASLLVSLTMTPFFATRILRTSQFQRTSRFRRFLDHFIETRYRSSLNYALSHPAKILIAALIVFLASLSLFPFIGVSFFPKAEKPQFFVNITLPQGMNLDETDSVARDVETLLADIPQVQTYASNVGRGNPRLYYNMFARRERSHFAQIFVELKSFDRQSQEKIIRDLRQKFREYPGAKIELKELEQGPPVEAPVAIQVFGDNLTQLREISLDVEDIVKSEIGPININNPLSTTKSDIQLRINRDKAAMLGVRLSDIDFTVRMALAGVKVSEYRDDDGTSYDIVIRLPMNGEPDLKVLESIYIASMSGNMIPLKQLADIELSASPLFISHYHLERSVLITADVAHGYSVDLVTRRIIDKLENYSWPKRYRYSIVGEMESRQESFSGMTKAILAAMIAIFGVLVLQFRSYSQPLIVFSAIPLAVIGSILGLFITGYSFSFSAFIGLTSLVGIVVNNSILLVDYSNQLLRDGVKLKEAVQEAAETRFTPIILTVATTIGGLLPLTLTGGTLWAPMGWTIIGGLLISTVLTLLIVPVLYRLFTKTETQS